MLNSQSDDVEAGSFVWSRRKDELNRERHGLSFLEATNAFSDVHRVILADASHGGVETRYYCLGLISGTVATIRFTYREGKIRIFGAGYWRKGRKIYEAQRQ